MNLFDKIFRKGPKNEKYFQMMNGGTPIFTQFGTNIYASDVVQQVLKCIADEIKKLQPQHIRYNESDPVPVKGNIQNVLDNPNPLMTSSEFLEKITYLLLLNYNVFILPTYYTWTEETIDEAGNKIEIPACTAEPCFAGELATSSGARVSLAIIFVILYVKETPARLKVSPTFFPIIPFCLGCFARSTITVVSFFVS